MRDIKFRAWIDGGAHYFGLGESAFVKISEDGYGTTLFLSEADAIEQYTGLKDKNGKEIYEGDVCRDYKYSGAHKPITFSNGCFCWGDVLPLSQEIYKLEIVGNIHELNK